MQVDLSTKKLKALAKRLDADLGLTPDQRRRTLDALARGLGHPSYAALKPALDTPHAGQPSDPLDAALALLADPSGLDEPRGARLEHAATRFLRGRDNALCLLGLGDVTTAIVWREGREADEDDLDRLRARHWMAGQGRDLEEAMAREGNEALAQLIEMAPPPDRGPMTAAPADDPDDIQHPGNGAWLVAITLRPAWADAPADPETAAAALRETGDARAMAQRDYWTIVEAEDPETARERALDVFHDSVPIRHLEAFDIDAEVRASHAEIPGSSAYCAGTYKHVAAYLYLGRITR